MTQKIFKGQNRFLGSVFKTFTMPYILDHVDIYSFHTDFVFIQIHLNIL